MSDSPRIIRSPWHVGANALSVALGVVIIIELVGVSQNLFGGAEGSSPSGDAGIGVDKAPANVPPPPIVEADKNLQIEKPRFPPRVSVDVPTDPNLDQNNLEQLMRTAPKLPAPEIHNGVLCDVYESTLVDPDHPGEYKRYYFPHKA